MKKLISIILSVLMICTSSISVKVRAEEQESGLGNEPEPLSTSDVLVNGAGLIGDWNWKLVFDEGYTPKATDPISLKEIVYDYSQGDEPIINTIKEDAYSDFRFGTMNENEGTYSITFCPKPVTYWANYKMTVTDTNDKEHVYDLAVEPVTDIIPSNNNDVVFAPYYSTYRIIINNNFDENTIENIFINSESNPAGGFTVLEGGYNSKMIYFFVEEGAEDCTFKCGNTELAIKPYYYDIDFALGRDGSFGVDYNVRYRINFDGFEASTENGGEVYLKNNADKNVLMEGLTKDYVYIDVKDTSCAGNIFTLCVKDTEGNIQETNFYVQEIPEKYNPETGITISSGSSKKIDLEENECWSKYLNPRIYPVGNPEANVYSDNGNDNSISAYVYSNFLQIYCGFFVEAGDYILEYTYNGNSSKEFTIHVTGSDWDIPKNHNLETADKVSTYAELNASINKFKYQSGGVIQITGMDEVTEDIVLKHVEPIVSFTSGSTNINDDSYRDYLLIDLTCDLDLGSHQLVFPAMDSEEKKHHMSCDSGIIIRGNGHTITSSNEEATVIVEGECRILFKDVTIINTYEAEPGFTNDACALLMEDGFLIGDQKTLFKGPVGAKISDDGCAYLFGQSSMTGTKGPALVIGNRAHTSSNIYNATTQAADNIAIVCNATFDGDSNTLDILGNVNGTIVWNSGKLYLSECSSINSVSDCIRINSDAIKPEDNFDKEPAVFLILNVQGDLKANLQSLNGSCIAEVSETKSALKQLKVPNGSFTCADSSSIFNLGSHVDRNANNIEISGGTYSKKLSDNYLNTLKYSWSETAPYTLSRNGAIDSVNVDSYTALIYAIACEAETINITKNFSYNESASEVRTIDIPYPVTINLNGHTLTGYCLKLSKEYGEGITADTSEIINGTLVADGIYAIENRSWVSLHDVKVRAADDYEGFVVRSSGSSVTSMHFCEVYGYKGIDFARDANFDINMIPLQFGDTTIQTEDIAISDENAVGRNGIHVGDNSLVYSTGNTAIKLINGTDCGVGGGTVKGINGIESNSSVSLNTGAKVISTYNDQSTYDADNNAAIILKGFRLESNKAEVSSDSKHAIIVDNEDQAYLLINGGYYKSSEEVIEGIKNFDTVSVSRGHFSSQIDAKYLPSGWSCISVDTSDTPYAIVQNLGSGTVAGHAVNSYLNAEDVAVTVDAGLIQSAIAEEDIDKDTTIIFSAAEETEENITDLESQINKDIIDCYDLSVIKKTVGNNNNDVFDELHEINEKQIITIDLSDNARANDEELHMFHEDDLMKEVSSLDELISNSEDCVFIDKDNGKVHIKTSSFSPFSIISGKVDHTFVAPTKKTSLTYDGSAQALVEAGSITDASGCDILYSLNNEDWSTDIPTATNAGTYSVYYKIVGTETFNEVSSVEISNIVISKLTPTLTLPSAKENLKYNGESLELINAGTTNKGTLKYAAILKNEEAPVDADYGDAVPTATSAGTYTVYYKVFGNENINSTEPACFDVSVAKAIPVVTAPTAKSELEYNGTNQKLINAGSSTLGSLKYAIVVKGDEAPTDADYGTSLPEAKLAKTYTVYYKVFGDNNIGSTTAAHFDVTIDKASITYTFPQYLDAVYGQTYDDIVLPEGVSFKVETDTSVGDVGNCDVELVYTPEDTANYYTIEGVSTLRVSKADSLVKNSPNAETDLVYTGSPLSLVSAGTPEGGTIKYVAVNYGDAAPEDSSYGTAIPTATNAGKYDVYYKVFGDSNHNDTVAEKITSVILKADITSYTKPEIVSVNKADHVLLSSINLPEGWSWIDGTKEVSDINEAKYHKDDNHNDLFTTIAIGLKETVQVGTKNVELTTSFESNGGSSEASNSGAVKSVIDALTNPNSKTKFSGTMGTILAGLNDSDSVEIKTSLDVNDNYTPTDVEQQKINNVLQGSTITKIMQIDLVIKVKINSGAEQSDKIHELSDSIEVAFQLEDGEIPSYNGSTQELVYQLVEIHDGVAKVINCRFDAENKTVTANLNGFSTYAIICKVVDKTLPSNDSPTGYKVVNTSVK